MGGTDDVLLAAAFTPMERDILHIHIPIFPITLARACDPSLRRRPVAVAPSHSERTPVQCVSSEARRDGIFEGMPLFRAKRLCPSLIVLPPDPGKLSSGTNALVRLSMEYTPLWEPSSAGRLYLDLTGSGRLLGPGRDAALRLEKDLQRRLNFAGAVGVAGNKLVSSIAARCLEGPGICDVLRGSEADFIAPMPVSVLPGVGSVRERTLMADLNLRLVGQVAALTVSQLALAFGPFAPLLHARAVGIDPSPVLTPRRIPEVVEESHLNHAENNDTFLLAELYRLAEGCGTRLRRMGKRVSYMELLLTYSDGVSARRSAVMPVPVDDDRLLFAKVRELFMKTCERRVGVRLLRLVCRRLAEPDPQLDLFVHAEGKADTGTRTCTLQCAIDNVRKRFGTGAVQWGRSITSVQRPTFNVQREELECTCAQVHLRSRR
jgi:DNA polymerase-4